jgi:ATPase subunit of ABC transporter with duplicated ATPase domains
MKNLLQLVDIHKSYGAQVILDGLSVVIHESHKIGVIGRNGAGKSTLCKIQSPPGKQDRGSVQKSAGSSWHT